MQKSPQSRKFLLLSITMGPAGSANAHNLSALSISKDQLLPPALRDALLLREWTRRVTRNLFTTKTLQPDATHAASAFLFLFRAS